MSAAGEEGAVGEEGAARAGVAWVIREVGDPTRAGVGVEAQSRAQGDDPLTPLKPVEGTELVQRPVEAAAWTG